MMIYEALKPYIQIFDNEFISFIELCSKRQLIDFNHIKVQQHNIDNCAKSKTEENFRQIQEKNVNDRNKIRKYGSQSNGR